MIENTVSYIYLVCTGMEYLKFCLEKPIRANTCLNLAIINLIILIIISGHFLKLEIFLSCKCRILFMFAMRYTQCLHFVPPANPVCTVDLQMTLYKGLHIKNINLPKCHWHRFYIYTPNIVLLQTKILSIPNIVKLF